MKTKMLEVREDDLKKLLLVLKNLRDKKYVNVPSTDIQTFNQWTFSRKVELSVMRKANLSYTTDKYGRTKITENESTS